MKVDRAVGATLGAALALVAGTSLAFQLPAPAPSAPPSPVPWVFPPLGPSPLPAPPLAVNPSAPQPVPTASPFTPFWPAQIQIPGLPQIAQVAVQLPTVPYWSPARVLVLPHPADLINLKVLADIVQQNLQGGRRCGLREMAPGIYVRLDCRPGQPVVASRDVFSPQKMQMLYAGKLHVAHNRPAAAPTQTETPSEVVDHRTEGLEGPVKDQGSVGDCTAFSLSTAMDNAILRLHKSDVVSPLHIWSHYGFPELSQGASSNMGKPIALLGVWPYSPRQACELAKDPEEQCGQAYSVRTNSSALDPVLQAQLLRAEASGAYRLAGIDRISSRPVNPDAIAAVLETGADVLTGMEIDSTAWKVGAQNAVIPDYVANEGGHAIVVAGYRKVASGRQFLLHNSWGGTWGDHGFAWISENMVRQHMEYAFKVRVVDPSGAEPVSQTDDACPDNQLVDSGSGKCAPMCRNQTRSTNGKC